MTSLMNDDSLLLRKLIGENKYFRDELADTIAREGALMDMLQTAGDTISKVLIQVEELDCEIASLKETKQCDRAEMESLRLKLEDADRREWTLSVAFNESKDECKYLTQQITLLHGEVELCLQRISSLSYEFEQSSPDKHSSEMISKLQLDGACYQEMLEAKSIEIQTLNDALLTEREHLLDARGSLEAFRSSQNSEVQALREIISHLTTSVENSKMEGKINDNGKNLESSSTDATLDIESDLASALTMVASLSQERNRLIREVSDLHEKLADSEVISSRLKQKEIRLATALIDLTAVSQREEALLLENEQLRKSCENMLFSVNNIQSDFKNSDNDNSNLLKPLKANLISVYSGTKEHHTPPDTPRGINSPRLRSSLLTTIYHYESEEATRQRRSSEEKDARRIRDELLLLRDSRFQKRKIFMAASYFKSLCSGSVTPAENCNVSNAD